MKHLSILVPQGNVIVEGLNGTSWTHMNGMSFTTKDKDHDMNAKGNCANSREGGGWFTKCTWLNMNGRYGAGGNADVYMHWIDFKKHVSLKSISLSIKRS